jgi:HEPN domain-containing protein
LKTHRLINMNVTNPVIANLRCPHCNHQGAFHPIVNCNDVGWVEGVANQAGQVQPTGFAAGVRKCPNPECSGLVQVVLQSGQVVESFPPEVIDFDSTNLPPAILASLEEAIKAHAANCYKASALMVRRVLEELCDDKNAVGGDLKQRLAALSQSVVVPKELLDAADELRLLGNDAAHVKAKNYDAVGKDEASLAIELAKELLKAVYQYTSLVDRLKALKKP